MNTEREMTISFKANFLDQWYYMGYLSYRTVTGRILVMLFLLLPLLGYSLMLYNSQPNLPYHRFLLHHFWLACLTLTGLFYFVNGLSFVTGLFLGAALIPKQTITINEEVCIIRNIFTTKMPWRRFLRIAEEPEYFYFLGWSRTAFVPKRVFESRADAQAFFEFALSCWRQAKGIPPPPLPDTTGVWPPAPSHVDSQEPDSSP